MKRHLILLSAFLSLSPIAYAEWQYTKWGMDVQEVLAAAKTAKAPIRKETSNKMLRAGHLLTGHYSTSSYEFTSTFVFTKAGKKLNSILLVPVNFDNCARILQDLNKTYGDAVNVKAGDSIESVEWHDKEKNNHVLFINGQNDYCALAYKDLAATLAPPDGL